MSSFITTLQSLSPRCCMLSFKITGLLVLEKNISKSYTIYGHGGYLGHVLHAKFQDHRTSGSGEEYF